ncbi:MAG: iron donor protein CyaY [Gammaproteobacteria bacterium 39-13]|nr:iron donor protein CyaY [Gammaproteobacteria bacterium]OJV89984.1 MAG: iron donor protein CyaY [Gammaproteobacteria bacterium 39-13]
MEAQEFHAKADELFLAIEQWLETESDDIDFESQEGLLTIILPNTQRLIFSRQTSLGEIWLASPQGAYHFQYQNGAWRTRQDQLLLETLVAIVEAQANIRLDLTHFGK